VVQMCLRAARGRSGAAGEKPPTTSSNFSPPISSIRTPAAPDGRIWPKAVVLECPLWRRSLRPSGRRPDEWQREAAPAETPSTMLTGTVPRNQGATHGAVMTNRLQYGATAKVLHWLVVALLAVQFLIGWFMPDVHAGPPASAMTLHISFGISILALIVLRFVWRLAHPVAPESSLPPWQRVTSEAVHWLLYALVLATTVTGWLFASFRGWSVSYFYLVPLPMLADKNADGVHAIDGWHQIAEWTLLIVIGVHVAAALAHIFIYRDRIMQRMLPSRS
jgi:cytochrome b561